MRKQRRQPEPRLCVVCGRVAPVNGNYARNTCSPACLLARVTQKGKRAEVLALSRAGRNGAEIARELGISRQRVYQILNKEPKSC